MGWPHTTMSSHSLVIWARSANDLIHNSGIANAPRPTARSSIGFSEREQMFLTAAMYFDLLCKWPRDELLREPDPPDHTRNLCRGRARHELIDEIQAEIDCHRPTLDTGPWQKLRWVG